VLVETELGNDVSRYVCLNDLLGVTLSSFQQAVELGWIELLHTDHHYI